MDNIWCRPDRAQSPKIFILQTLRPDGTVIQSRRDDMSVEIYLKWVKSTVRLRRSFQRRSKVRNIKKYRYPQLIP